MKLRPADGSETGLLAGQRVAVVGKLAGMSKRDAQQLIRQHGGTAVETPDGQTTLVVIGERDASSGARPGGAALDDAARQAHDRGTLTVVGESQFWQQLGLVGGEHLAQRLYTPAMLAGLIGESVSTIRRWQRHGWLLPKREVRRLAYFNFEEVATARRIQELLAAGMSPAVVGKTLAALARQLPAVKRPLAELSIVIQGKQLLVRQEGGLVEPGGQLRFDFEVTDDAASPGAVNSSTPAGEILSFPPRDTPP